MVLGAIWGTILASKSHQKINQKIAQILDGFWKEFGSPMGSNWDPFWLPKSIKNQARFLKERGDGYHKGSAAEAGLRRVLFFAQRLIYLDKDYDNVSYTPTNAPGGCCGGLSTLRGTPPQHLFDVDPFWNDPLDSNSAFKHRSILKMCLEPLWVSMGGSWAPFWELWGLIFGAKIVNFGSLGGALADNKHKAEKRGQKGGPDSFPYTDLRYILASFFLDFWVIFVGIFF